jgi:hypothetical protein
MVPVKQGGSLLWGLLLGIVVGTVIWKTGVSSGVLFGLGAGIVVSRFALEQIDTDQLTDASKTLWERTKALLSGGVTGYAGVAPCGEFGSDWLLVFFGYGLALCALILVVSHFRTRGTSASSQPKTS